MAKTANASLSTIEEKTSILEDMGRTDLVEIFREWKPRSAPAQEKKAPLDQRVTVVVGDGERRKLDMELKTLKKSGEKVSLSSIIRSRALGNVDIHEWAEKARDGLTAIEETQAQQLALNRKERELVNAMESMSSNDESRPRIENELVQIRKRLRTLVSQKVGRKNRLTGRMTMAESELVKWRAQRLCLSTSDYLRLVIFDLAPVGEADITLSYDAKVRFYISIMDVARNGWGNPPEITHCSQCDSYLEEITKLKARIKQLNSFT